MFYGITLIILGVLAAPSLLLSRKPNAQELLDKITPYQGWIGLVVCLWGVWGIISAILNIGWMSLWPIYWFSWMAANVLQALLGFLLGYGMINKYLLSKSEEAKKKGEEFLAKMAPRQGKLGLFSILLGGWLIITSIFFYGV